LKHKTQELNRNKKDLPVVVADGADKYALVVAFIQAE
jgi:flagellar biosynthesis protein FlhB